MAAVANIEEQLKNVRISTRQRDEGEQLLKARGIPIGETTLPNKDVGTDFVSKVQVTTNMFPLNLSGKVTVHQYRVDLYGYFTTARGVEKRKDYTFEVRADAVDVDTRYNARKIFNCFVSRNEGIIPPRHSCFFDLRNCLFTVGRVLVDDTGKLSLSVERGDVAPDVWPAAEHIERIEIVIADVEKAFVVEDVKRGVPTVDPTDRSFQHFLEIAAYQQSYENTDEHVVFENGKSYLLNPAKYGFSDRDTPEMGYGTYIAVGAQKSVRIIEGEQHLEAAFLIETKKTPFHMVQLVSDKILLAFPHFNEFPNGDLSHVERLLRKLVVYPVHLRPQRFVHVRGLTRLGANTQTFSHNDEEITVEAYYKQRYNITLQYPKLPLIYSENREKERSYYPMELCEVADNQRLSNAAITGEQVAQLIRLCAVPPRTVQAQIFNNAKALSLLSSPFLRTAGVTLVDRPIEVTGRVIQPPVFIYGQNFKSEYDSSRYSWRAGKSFVNPANVKIWAVYVLDSENKFNAASMSQFIGEFIKEARMKGINLPNPAEAKVEARRQIEVADIFERAKKGNCEYLVFITSKSDTKVHALIKKFEQRHEIVTQNITTTVAADACGVNGRPKRLTMENLINKANVKNGGLNYLVGDSKTNTFLGVDDLYLGFGTNHPAGGLGDIDNASTPSVIGYAANDLKHPCAFTGDYVYQEPRRDEKIQIIEEIVSTVLTRYHRNRGKYPKRVFLFRNGCSEGQFEMIMKYEIPLVEHLLAKTCDAKLVVVIPNKLHNVRLFPSNIRGEKAPEQNLQPGTIVDQRIVHPYIPEFYCLAHVARQGTAKIPRYSVLRNSANVSMNELQSITYFLSYGHQIITGATGLPSPCFIANRYAERGRMNLMTYTTESDPKDLELDAFAKLTDKLAYAHNSLRDRRFNA